MKLEGNRLRNVMLCEKNLGGNAQLNILNIRLKFTKSKIFQSKQVLNTCFDSQFIQ